MTSDMIPLFKVAMSDAAPLFVGKVLRSGFIGQGPEVEKFEDALWSVLPTNFARPVSTNSCTSAIHMVLTHLGIGPGDEVITTPMTCVATNAPILAVGAKIVWADVDVMTGLIDPHSVASKITDRTRAIIGVDWTGRRAPYKRLKQIASVGNIAVIQDAAHGPLFNDAYFEEYNRGDYVCFSFGPIKHLTSGVGGAVVPPSMPVGDALRKLRWYGLDRTSSQDFRCAQDIVKPGMNWHMNDINAAIGMANLPNMLENISKHWGNAYEMHRRFKTVLSPKLDNESNYWVYPILLSSEETRTNFKKHLEDLGIMASQVHARNDKHTGYIPSPILGHAYPVSPLPGVDYFDTHQINIPCGWWLSASDVDRIVAAVNSFEDKT